MIEEEKLYGLKEYDPVGGGTIEEGEMEKDENNCVEKIFERICGGKENWPEMTEGVRRRSPPLSRFPV